MCACVLVRVCECLSVRVQVRIAHCTEEKERFTAEGFTMLPQNLNEQSSSSSSLFCVSNDERCCLESEQATTMNHQQ